MILETLLAGMLMAVGGFAVKVGMGLRYLLSRKPREGRARGKVVGLFALGYLGLFALCGFTAEQWDGQPGSLAQGVLASGMLLHVTAATGLMVWGVHLLRRPRDGQGSTRGWLAMVVPCPVCMVILILSMVAARTFFPEAARGVMMGVYGAFMGIALLTALAFPAERLNRGVSPERTLGWAMLFTSVYFFVSILLLPSFQDAGDIYQVAGHLAAENGVAVRQVLGAEIGAAVLFALGFLFTRARVRRVDPWT